jgi:hypothetical protein
MPERYGTADRFLYAVEYPDGRRTFVVVGKVSSGNPFEVSHATMGGMDLRASHVVIYKYDGKGTITEINQDGGSNVYSGENGNPDFLLGHIRQSLGTKVSR